MFLISRHPDPSTSSAVENRDTVSEKKMAACSGPTSTPLCNPSSTIKTSNPQRTSDMLPCYLLDFGNYILV